MALSLFPAASPAPGEPGIKNTTHRDELQGVAIRISSGLTTKQLTIQPANRAVQHASSNGAAVSDAKVTSPASRTSSEGASSAALSNSQVPLKGILKKSSKGSIRSNATSTSSRDSDQASTTSPGGITVPQQATTAYVRTPPQQVIGANNVPLVLPPPPPRRDSKSKTPSPKQKRRISPILEVDQLERDMPLLQSRHGSPTPSYRTGSPSIKRSDSMKKAPIPDSPSQAAPMRSMFPTYDFSKPLSEQNYYPAVSVNPRIRHSPPKLQGRPTRTRNGLFEGYEHIPSAEESDLESLWQLASGDYPDAARKAQYGLYQPKGAHKDDETALAIGIAPNQLIYDMNMDLTVRRHQPNCAQTSPVAQLELPDIIPTSHRDIAPTEVFPNAAAVDVMEQLSRTLNREGYNMAMIQEATLEEVYARYACQLTRQTRRRDQLSGIVNASYQLAHPKLGVFPIEVTKSQSAQASVVPKAMISLHHPSATPPAIAAGTLNLAFLDFARDSCVLDLPGLMALGEHYLVDTVVCALLAVAVIENDALVAESMVFDAPPLAPVQQTTTNSSKKSKKLKSKKKAYKNEKGGETEAMLGEEVELPFLARGTLAVLGVSVKAAVFVLTTGLKVTTGVVSHLATRL